jgi:hypothetical protein
VGARHRPREERRRGRRPRCFSNAASPTGAAPERSSAPSSPSCTTRCTGTTTSSPGSRRSRTSICSATRAVPTRWTCSSRCGSPTAGRPTPATTARRPTSRWATTGWTGAAPAPGGPTRGHRRRAGRAARRRPPHDVTGRSRAVRASISSRVTAVEDR